MRSLSTLGTPRSGTQIEGLTQLRYVVDHASVGLPWLVVALIVLVIAEAFDIGVSLADDVDGLV